MARRRMVWIWCLVAGLAGGPPADAVEIGATRLSVLQELGRPVSAVARGDREILTYAGGVRIALKEGKVVTISGLQPAGTPPAAPAEVATPEPAAATPDPAPEPEEPKLTKEEETALAEMEKKAGEAHAKAMAEMEKSLSDIENMHNQAPPEPPGFNVLQFALELGLKWLLTLAALKLSFKYWGAEIFWTGLMTVALVDVVVRGLVGIIGFKLLQMTTLFYADEAIAAAVMVLLLQKLSINRALAQAVQITLTTKTFSIVVGSLLITVLLRLMA